MSTPFAPSCSHNFCTHDYITETTAHGPCAYTSSFLHYRITPIPICPSSMIELPVRRFPNNQNPYPSWNAWELLGPTPTNSSVSYWIGGLGEVKLVPINNNDKEWRAYSVHDTMGSEVWIIVKRREPTQSKRRKWWSKLQRRTTLIFSIL